MRLTQILLLFFSILPISIIARKWQTGDECPDAIEATVPGYEWSSTESDKPTTFGTMVSIHDALSSCPNITSLALRVTGLGCSEWPDRWNFPFKLEGGETYPTLKELRLEGYNFKEKPFDETDFGRGRGWMPYPEKMLHWVHSGNAWKHLRYLNMDPVQRNKTNLDLWFDAMDWSQIESFALRGGSVPMEIAHRLDSLQQLKLFTRDADADMDFFNRVQRDTLTHLTIRQNPLPPLPIILSRQGQSLQHLEIRTEEVMSVDSPAYDASELSLLSHMTPNLTNLSINVHRNGTWPIEVFDAIASIPSLRTLDLWLDITSECRRQKPDTYRMSDEFKEWVLVNGECDGEDQYQQPFVSEAASLDMFKHLQDNKVGEPLKNVTFWVGDWSRAYDGPLYFPEWLEGKRAKVACGTEGKQDGEAWCIVEAGKNYWKRPNVWVSGWSDDD
jgi:hypothetical protein